MAAKILSIPAAIALFVAALAQAQEVSSLAVGECVRRALERGFDMEIRQQDLAISREALPIARSVFHPVLSGSAQRSVIRSPADALLPRTRTEGGGVNIGISQSLPMGTQIGLATSLNRSRINPAFTALNPAYASDLTLALRQSLLQGFGVRANTTDIRRAELELDGAWRDYHSHALDVVQATENAYYLLAGAHEQLTVFKASLQLAEKLLEEAKLRKASGMATGLDVLQSEVGVANARQGVLQAERDFKAGQDALLALIGRFEFDAPVNPVRLDVQVPPQPPTVESSYARALQRQPELLNAKAAIKSATLDIVDARNQLKPILDLDVAFGINGSEGSGRGALSSALNNESGSWQAGLTLIYPWGLGGGKARLRQAQAALRRQELSVEQLEQDLLLQVRDAVRQIETADESIRLTTLAAGLSERQYESERKRFKAGLTTSRRVLEAQTDLERARVAQLQARLDLQVALAALRRIEGSGLEYYGLNACGFTALPSAAAEPSPHPVCTAPRA